MRWSGGADARSRSGRPSWGRPPAGTVHRRARNPGCGADRRPWAEPGRPGDVRAPVRGARRRGCHGAGQAGGDRLLYRACQLRGLCHALVGEHLGEPGGVSLADGTDLPDPLPAVELQCRHGGLGVQAREGEGGDLGAVEPGDGDERRGDRTEPDGPARPQGQGQEHGDAVHRVGERLQVDCEPVVGRGLPGHLESGQLGRSGVGDPLDAVDRALLVPERGTGHDGRGRRHPDLQTGLGQRVILPPDQLGRHCPVPSTFGVVPCHGRSSRRRMPPGAARTDVGPRSGPATGAAGWTASGPGRSGRWPGFRGRSSAIRCPHGAPWP